MKFLQNNFFKHPLVVGSIVAVLVAVLSGVGWLARNFLASRKDAKEKIEVPATSTADQINISENNLSNSNNSMIVGKLVFPEKPARHLVSDVQVWSKIQDLTSDKKSEIQVEYVLSNNEASQFALEIQQYLKLHGWNVANDLAGVVRIPPGTGVQILFDPPDPRRHVYVGEKI